MVLVPDAVGNPSLCRRALCMESEVAAQDALFFCLMQVSLPDKPDNEQTVPIATQ